MAWKGTVERHGWLPASTSFSSSRRMDPLSRSTELASGSWRIVEARIFIQLVVSWQMLAVMARGIECACLKSLEEEA